MKVVVITGSTRGLGYALADRFLALGCVVAVCGRSEDTALRAADELGRRYQPEWVAGFRCDVRDPAQLQALWDGAVARLGRVDIWVNNAGVSNMQQRLWAVPAAEMAAVVDTNLLGVVYGSQVAARGMLPQGHGAIYNMEGMGSDGRMHEGLVPYGMTKRAVSYFTHGLAKELKGTPLIVGAIQPGMVATEMITSQYEGRPEEWQRVQRIFNIIASRPEAVAEGLAGRILANTRTGVCISYVSSWKMLWRFISAPVTRRDPFGRRAS
jgi:NAD(P)-dependent dehydrogenase (short-subunit alcohol dehydrogenase family)